MCGIIGYISGKSQKENIEVLIEGLKALEYRGYDSAGLVSISNENLIYKKSLGQVKNLEADVNKILNSSPVFGEGDYSIGIAHTRWATHGVPSELNSHPHTDCNENIFVIHNGIIENYKELKNILEKGGHVFKSQTDTEVIPHLLEKFLKENNNNSNKFDLSFLETLKIIKGAFAIAVIFKELPEMIYVAKLSSPLVIGIGENENYIASDPSALIGNTKKVIYLKDGEYAKVSKNNVNIFNFQSQSVEGEIKKEITELEWDIERAQKGDYPDFMMKEICEASEVLKKALMGRIKIDQNNPGNSFIKLGGLESIEEELKSAKRIIILGCGTSYYAGMVAEYLFKKVSKIPTEVFLASEFRYREEVFVPDTIVIAISQSGETADTIAAIKKCHDNNLTVIGIVNVVGSTISRITDSGVYNHAGPEIGVASTKAFISQLSVLALVSLYIAQIKNKSFDKNLISELNNLGDKMDAILKEENISKIKSFAEKYSNKKDFLYLGRNFNYPVALEGALKLKEISYIHAEGYAGGEMKHGPLAMIDENFPTFAIATRDKKDNVIQDKLFSNLEEIKARKGEILCIATEGDENINHITNDLIYIPETLEELEPLLVIIPMQLFAYYVGKAKNLDVDKPRNLAKSVTVE